MNWLDVSTYIHMNLGAVIAAFFFGAVIAGFFVAARCDTDAYRALKNDDEQFSFGIRNFKWVFGPILICTIFISFLPTHDRILEVKIAKIKNEALTQANLNKGVEAVERITKKLECKYLGGCEKEK